MCKSLSRPLSCPLSPVLFSHCATSYVGGQRQKGSFLASSSDPVPSHSHTNANPHHHHHHHFFQISINLYPISQSYLFAFSLFCLVLLFEFAVYCFCKAFIFFFFFHTTKIYLFPVTYPTYHLASFCALLRLHLLLPFIILFFRKLSLIKVITRSKQSNLFPYPSPPPTF
jgi:hypothetical protein